MNYTVFYEYFVNKSGLGFKAPPNKLYNTAAEGHDDRDAEQR